MLVFGHVVPHRDQARGPVQFDHFAGDEQFTGLSVLGSEGNLAIADGAVFLQLLKELRTIFKGRPNAERKGGLADDFVPVITE